MAEKRTLDQNALRHGCWYCRFLKTTCDQQRPSCSQCLLVGRKCNYGFVVVHVQPVQNTQAPPEAKQKESEHGGQIGFAKLPDNGGDNLPSSTLPSSALSSTLRDWSDIQLQILNSPIEGAPFGHSRTEGYFNNILPQSDVWRNTISPIATATSLLHASSKQPANDPPILHEPQSVSRDAIDTPRDTIDRAALRIDTSNPDPLSIIAQGLFNQLETSTPAHSLSSAEDGWKADRNASAKFVGMIESASDVTNPSHTIATMTTVIACFKTCLTFRRKMVFEEETLRSLVTRISKIPSLSESLFQWLYIVWPLPGLLEEADSIINDPSSCRIKSVIQDLLQLRPKMQVFMRTIISNLIKTEGPEALDPKRIEEHYFLSLQSQPGLFHPQYCFPDDTVVKASILSWISCLVADTTALRIIHSRPRLRKNCADVARTLLESGAYETASKLCQSVQFLSQRESLTYVHVVKTILAVVRAFFVEAGRDEEVVWCERCASATEERLRRLETTHPRTLCRAADVTDALVSAVKFRCAEDRIVVEPANLIM